MYQIIKGTNKNIKIYYTMSNYQSEPIKPNTPTSPINPSSTTEGKSIVIEDTNQKRQIQ